MSGNFTCPCDGPVATPPQNAAGLTEIAYRDTTYGEIRRALLTPVAGETELTAWRPGATGDLAVMIAEWWAYLGDILTFYNERIANEGYLGTATQAASVTALIRLLGYRPQPGIGATATLAALVQPGPGYGNTVTLPVGLQVQSKPGPGQTPQIFELGVATPIATPDVVAATAPLSLLAPSATTLLLAGGVGTVFAGDLLLLRPRGGGTAVLVAVSGVVIAAPPGGSKQTTLTVSFPNGTAPAGQAAAFRLDRPAQTASLWSLPGTAISGAQIQLSGLLRSLKIGDLVLLTDRTDGGTPLLTSVSGITDVVWDGTGAAPSKTSTAIFPHTQLTLASAMPAGWAAANITLFYGWAEVAALLDQPIPVWPGTGAATPSLLAGVTPFPVLKAAAPVLIADTSGAGLAAQATGGGGTLSVSGHPATPPLLQTPLSVMFNLLNVTRGKTVAKEVLGSGDPTVANQSFQLAKSPLTYLRPAAVAVSTLALTVNGQSWTEVPNFLGQAAGAQVFVTAQDSNQVTTVMFGDGVNGARLPAGTGNVVASYRFGSGAAAPPAGALMVIASPFPGLRALRNPLPAGGGADPDPAAQIATYAPRSVLTFGRAVSALDFEAIAAGVATGTRVAAAWAWDPAGQRGAVTVYVADDGLIFADVRAAMATVGDPNRPVNVVTAAAIPILLGIKLIITAAADPDAVTAAVTAALTDPTAGLFGEARLGIGQSVFDSQIAAACQTVPGYVAIKLLELYREDLGWEARELHRVPAGSYFSLDPKYLWLGTEVANG